MRKATVTRKTKETEIVLALNLDGQGKSKVHTGIGFLDHMFEIFAKHGLFDLELKAKGDLHVDIHHTNEDIGICLGEAFKKALKDKSGIRRVGSCAFPLDEAITKAVVDLSGRPYLKVREGKGSVQDRRVHPFSKKERYFYAIDDALDLWRSFTVNAGVTMHLWIEGEDAHHILETIFKSIARSLEEATRLDPRIKGIPSTKGTL